MDRIPSARHRPDRRAACARLALCAVGPALVTRVGAQAAFDLSQLMHLLSQVTSGQATFVERRSVAMLDKPLESSGRLSFDAPDTFVRETLKPRQERLAVVGNELTMSQGSRTRTVTLDSVPQAAVIIEAVRGTLTGNREAIERRFIATVAGSSQQWTLELVPREARLHDLVASIQVSGRQALLHEVSVRMADGDQSVMTIESVQASTSRAASAAS